MTSLFVVPKRRFLVFAAILATIGALFLELRLLPRRETVNPWPGYAVVAIEDSLPGNDALAIFRKIGMNGIISRETQTVQVSNFSGLDSHPLKAAGERFLAEDPRVDMYINSLHLYFETESKGKRFLLYYLPAASFDGGKLHSAFGGLRYSWEAIGGEPAIFPWTSLFITALSLVACVLASRGRRSLAVSCAIPFSLLGLAGFPSLVMAVLGFYEVLSGYSTFFPEMREFIFMGRMGSRPRLFRLVRNRRFACTLFCLGLSTLFLPVLFPALIFALLSAAGIAFLSILLLRLRQSRTEHRLFTPKTLSPSEESTERIPSPLTGRILACAITLSFFAGLALPVDASYLTGSHESLLSIPVPTGYTPAKGFSSKAVEEFRSGRIPSLLPDLSDYLEHMKYQNEFPYLRRTGFGMEGESTYTEFELDGKGQLLGRSAKSVDGVSKNPSEIIGSLPPNGIESVLYSCGRFVSVGFSSNSSRIGEENYLSKEAQGPLMTLLAVLLFTFFACADLIRRRKTYNLRLRRAFFIE